jgi:hypothetical protein
LDSLRAQKEELLKQLLANNTTIELRQKLRAQLTELESRISLEEARLISFKKAHITQLLRGGSSGVYDLQKEILDPFPVWSSLYFAFVMSDGTTIPHRTAGGGFWSAKDTLDALSSAIRDSGNSLDINSFVAQPQTVDKQKADEIRRSRDQKEFQK